MPLPIHWQNAGNVRFAGICDRLETATLIERYELLTFVRLHSARIRPRINDRWLILQMLRYFLDCIARGSDADTGIEDDSFDSPFDAARQLVRWFDWYRNAEKECAKIQKIADIIGDFYRNESEFCRNCVETGFLEHALVNPANRSFFLGWADDPILVDAHRESLKWGLAHETTEKS